MVCEILSVGTELLMGQVANTDAQYISQRLSALGISVYRHTVVGDNVGRLDEALATALSRSDFVITTGGLGPTEDDLTKETVAAHFGLKLIQDEASLIHIRDFAERAGKVMTDNNLKQALIPEGSIIMPNLNGTAPGCIIEKDDKTVAVLPGPPSELKVMFENSLYPYLQKKSGQTLISRYLHIFAGESIVETQLMDLFHSLKTPYRSKAVWVMNDDTIKAVRKLKDSTGQYLWQSSIVADKPNTLLGRPVYTSAYMPTLASGAKAVAFGDFKYYWIADRQGRSFKRLNELYAQTGQIGFVGSQRVDGKLILPEAIKVLQMKSAT
jgi:molybdenum cofactor synthesis domain-containing protein